MRKPVPVIGAVCLLSALLLSASCSRRGPIRVVSPDGTIVLSFDLVDGVPTYGVDVDGSPFINPSALGMVASEGGPDLAGNFTFSRIGRYSTDEHWTMPWGENKEHYDHCNGAVITLDGKDGVMLRLRFRCYDDGIAFRYEYDAPVKDSIKIMDELTRFNLSQQGTLYSIPASFDTYELLYRTTSISDVPDAQTPATFRTLGGFYGSIHEANLTDFPEMTLRRVDSLSFIAALAPYPDGVKAYVGGHFLSPWRTVQIGRDAPSLVNSSLILNLNDPCKMEDTGWIRPLKYVGVWWGMHLGINSWTEDSRHGATTESAMRYIDFAADNNIDGVLFEGWNKGWETWGSGKSAFDFCLSAGDFDMEKVTRYAKERNVQYIIHYETGGNIPNFERQLDTALRWATAHGIHALKTGYAGGINDGYNHHGQYMVRHYRRVVRKCAEYGLMLDVHEPIKATGIRRTYPVMMTREGARGMEWNAWSEGNPPEHQTILPFTRLLGGPMDYTPGTFDILYKGIVGNPDLKVWNGRPSTECRVNTTLAKQIADWVVLYSPMQMASDLIENYDHPAFQFFRDYDADIDSSRMLQGEIGDYVVVERRAGEKFFLGAVTDENARTLTQSLDFLPEGPFTATIYADGPDADWLTNPTSYTITKRTVTRDDTLSLVLAAGGGQAVTFIPEK